VQDFGGTVRFAVENYGDSELARRFGVTRYPVIFVDDVLVAKPKDFGFYGKGEGANDGRYTPFKSAASHERFRADLSRMITLILAGRKEDARAQATPATAGEIKELPAFTLSDLDGKALSRADLAGRVVLVELWATWCPPCRGTLGWLGELKKRHGDNLAVVTVAVESEEADVRKLAGDLKLPFVWAMGTPELVRALGDVSAVPTLLLFDRQGRTAGTFYGAPPGLHAEAESKLKSLIEQGGAAQHPLTQSTSNATPWPVQGSAVLKAQPINRPRLKRGRMRTWTRRSSHRNMSRTSQRTRLPSGVFSTSA
jgi:thiol-disulfide isomerase/thioredoxin